MDSASNHEDTTTTDYDSGDSEGVSYAYEGGKGAVCLKQHMADPSSPKRKPKSGSPKGKLGSPTRCVCEASRQQSLPQSLSRSRSPSESDDDESTQFEEDTDVEGGVEYRRRPVRRRLSGPGSAKSSGGVVHRSASKKSSTKRTSRRRSPYIEEYPPDETWRPVILLKEHKLPRRFSASDAKQTAQDPGGRLDAGSASRGRSPPAKRLATSAAQPEVQQSRKPHPTVPPRKRLSEMQSVPGGNFSDSDLGNSESESEQEKLMNALELSMPRHRGRVAQPASETTSSFRQRVAWPQQPQYASSWPLQSGSRQSVSRSSHDDEYDSEDESDHVPNAYQRHGRYDGQIGHSEEQRSKHGDRRMGHVAHSNLQDADQHHSLSRRPSHNDPARHVRVPLRPVTHDDLVSSDQAFAPPHHAQARRQSHTQERVPHQQSRQPRPPRPVVARTIVSQRSMADIDQGHPRASTATSLCEIWRGRPEDWESPYSSSDDEDSAFVTNLDGEPVPTMKHLTLQGSPNAYLDSSASCFSRRSRSRSRGPSHHQYPHHRTVAADGFLRRSDATATFCGVGSFLRCESPERTVSEDDEERMLLGLPLTRGRRAVSKARSRWTVMALEESEWNSPIRRWTFGGAIGYGTHAGTRERSPSPVFSARKTRDFLSPKPRRPERFDFDAWGRERGSRSMLALGLNPVSMC